MKGIEEEIEATLEIKPCDYFDLIGGTSTGGLIMIMLEMLGMVCLLLPTNSITRTSISASKPTWISPKKYLKLTR